MPQPPRLPAILHGRCTKSAVTKMSPDVESKLAMLMSMGFDRDQSIDALDSCGGNIENAIDRLLSGGTVGGVGGIAGIARQGGGNNNANDIIDCIHCEMSQYSDASHGRSACTAIALVLASKLLYSIAATSNTPEDIIDSDFLCNGIKDGIRLYSAIIIDGRKSDGVEHTTVEEILQACENDGSSSSSSSSEDYVSIVSTLKQTDEPRQGILSNSSVHPFGLESILHSCQDKETYIAVVITKPPETVLVLLPPHCATSPTYILLDSHPRPQQLLPHAPSGSYALVHSTLAGIVGSLKQIFPLSELGDDVPEMVTVMVSRSGQS